MRVLEQFQVAEKLSQLDVLNSMYQDSEAAWLAVKHGVQVFRFVVLQETVWVS